MRTRQDRWTLPIIWLLFEKVKGMNPSPYRFSNPPPRVFVFDTNYNEEADIFVDEAAR